MVYKVLGRLRPQDCIRTLNIVGHGSAGTIVVGSSRLETVRGKRINRNEEEWRDLLGRLAGRFCTGAKVGLTPVLILPGIDQPTADVLRETVGVVTVGDLAATGAKTTAAALAGMIRDLDRD